MRATALAWSMLGTAGIATSLWQLANHPMADTGLTTKILIILIVCAVALFSIFSAIRGVLVPQLLFRLDLHLFLFVILLLFAIASIAIIANDWMHQPVAPATVAISNAALLAAGMAALVGAWAIFRDRAFGRPLLTQVAVLVTMCCVVVSAVAGRQLASIWHVAIIALLVLCGATLWQARRPAVIDPMK